MSAISEATVTELSRKDKAQYRKNGAKCHILNGDLLLETFFEENILEHTEIFNNYIEKFEIEKQENFDETNAYDYVELIKKGLTNDEQEEMYREIINHLIQTNKKYMAGDILYLYTRYESRPYYGRAFIDYDVKTQKKIISEDGEGEPSLFDYSIEILKTRKVTYKRANIILADQLDVLSDSLCVPYYCKKIDNNITSKPTQKAKKKHEKFMKSMGY